MEISRSIKHFKNHYSRKPSGNSVVCVPVLTKIINVNESYTAILDNLNSKLRFVTLMWCFVSFPSHYSRVVNNMPGKSRDHYNRWGFLKFSICSHALKLHIPKVSTLYLFQFLYWAILKFWSRDLPGILLTTWL